ncbi:hypothetical protein L1049_015262 [Liquidambar formosana]|uniref:Protein LNK1 n=1 Tax=Liquidambar formosana TaxID=63359 RepID=A0AAP0X2E4_LIQFO
MYYKCWVESIGGMSDLCMYELEDLVWDGFSESDDHIVPHHGNEHGDGCPVEGDSRKKPRREVIAVTNSADNRSAVNYVSQGKEETSFPTMKNKNNTMLEKGSWSHTPVGVFPASCDSDSIKEEASDDTRMSSQGFKNSNIESVGDVLQLIISIVIHLITFLNQAMISAFLIMITEDKESSDLLYYGWADIGNFEDVDRMFRSCDSTFGLASGNNEVELCWFSSSHATEGSEDAQKPGFKFSCSESNALKSISENHEVSQPNNESLSVNGSNKRSASNSCKTSSRTSDSNEPSALGHISFVNGLDIISESKDDYAPREQINLHEKQSKQQNQSEGKRKDCNLENGGSFHRSGTRKQSSDVKLPFGDSSCQVLSAPGIRQQKQNVGPDSLSYLQTHIPHTQLDYSHTSDQISFSTTLSSVKSENNGQPSFCTKDSSYASNQVRSVESSHDPSFEAPAITMDEKREKLYRQQGLQASFTRNSKCDDLVVQAAFCDSVSIQKKVHPSENEVEGHSEVEGVSIEIPAELDSSNVQESSCMSSVLDEISIEATSFCQLQHVMEQLDIRTKLCIRDSLYRLARSAEQRHNCASLDGGSRDDRDTNEAMIADTNKCTGFMDMETNTNPIDRAIAHLLFHRPSDPSVMSANDALPLKYHNLIPGPVISPPVMAEKIVGLEETAGAADEKSLITDANE